MPNSLEFTLQARDDVRDAYAWYEQQSPGLGERFLRHVDECLAFVAGNPEMFERVYKSYRRAIVRRFPYVVFYRYESQRITVHSVFHSAQNPRKWRKRLS